jgi:alpha-soluble NSF attachment protein
MEINQEQYEQEAMAFITKAKSLLKANTGIFSFIQDKDNNCEEASHCYVLAGNKYKLIGKWEEAGAAFYQAGIISPYNSTECFINASKCYTSIGKHQDAVNLLYKAIHMYLQNGKFIAAAKQFVNIGLIYENNIYDLEKAISAYQYAADYYVVENSTTTALPILLKMGKLNAQLEHYENAIETFDKAITTSSNTMSKYNIPEYFFLSSLCRLCMGDFEGIEIVTTRCEALYCSLHVDPKRTFIVDLANACIEKNIDQFSYIVSEFNKTSSTDDLTVALLLRIRRLITNEQVEL